MTCISPPDLHYQTPGSPIAYYQQVGRAGRAVDRAVGVLMTGWEDTDIQDWFIDTAFPSEVDTAAALTFLRDHPGSTVRDLEGVVNLRRSRLDSMLKILEVERAVYREGSKWFRSAEVWEYPAERIAAVTAHRRAEQAAMTEYVSTTGCLMEFLRRQLDDPGAGRCGRCANCAGPALPTTTEPELVEAALRSIRTGENLIQPRRRLPCPLDIDVDLKEHGLELGRCLTRWGEPGLAELVAEGKYLHGTFPPRLVDATAEMVSAWSSEPPPTWLTYVPSRSGELVADFARALAAELGLPCVDAFERKGNSRPQKEMENSCQQARNVAGSFQVVDFRPGPVFLVDDMVDSRWTSTVLGSLLRSEGSGPVYPVALADTSHRGPRMFTDDAKAIIALTTRLGGSDRPSLSPGRWHRLAVALGDAGLRPADVFGGHLSDLSGLDDSANEVIRSLVADAGGALLEADELARKGIWILTVADDGYPDSLSSRLGSQAPPVLFGAGDKQLLARAGIGVVGSRDVDDAGAEVARRLAAEAVRLDRPVVSGGARGADQLAMNAAYQAGGSVVGVLADSLAGRIRRPDTLVALDGGNTCLVSQQSPAAGFTAAAAMARNKLIYALSAVTVVVASALESGGTWAGAIDAIKARNGTVAVWQGTGAGPGNLTLVGLGATSLGAVEDLGGLLTSEIEPGTEQLSLY